MKQTAVEWYFDKIKSHFEHDGDLYEVACMTYSIAKEMEKEQIIEAYYYDPNCNEIKDDGEQYYKETYKQG